MAEKGFGVKEVYLIGASGTPTIKSPNNLNLNAVNVAISTNATIGGTLAVTGNVSVGGTLTYEDVTSIDSVGVVTARAGVVTPNVDVDDFVTVGSNIQLGHAGVVTATTFSGSGASLTSIPAGQLTGTVADARISTLTASKLSGALPAISGANLTNLPATDPTDSDIQVAYTVTANGSSAYRFAGNGVVSTADNPDLSLIRGKKYRFINNSGGSHPFQIRESSGGTAYSTGVTNNGAASGNIDFAPTFDSPAQLVYQCTSHGGMVGNIYLRGGNGNENNVGVITATNGGTSGLTMADQWRLTVGQTINTQDVVLTSWARPNTSGTGGGAYVGGGMYNSSGTFSFPTTGIYLITFHASFNGTNNTRYSEIDIVVTKNNSTYVEAARSFFYFNRPTGTSTGASSSCSFIMDVDNISNDKVRFESSQDNVGQHQVLGDTGNATLTTVTFLRLGDT